MWTSETSGKSTRNIPGIDGSLAAIQTNGETPVLQLHDLQGDIAATAALSPSETKLLSTYNSTEFGVPNKEKAPPKFAWLGAGGVASSLSSGVITYGATSYVPQVGRALQSEVVEAPGIAPHGTGAGAAYVSHEEPWMLQGAAAEAAEAPGLEAARERESEEAAKEGAEGGEASTTAGDPVSCRFTMTETQEGSLDEHELVGDVSWRCKGGKWSNIGMEVCIQKLEGGNVVTPCLLGKKAYWKDFPTAWDWQFGSLQCEPGKAYRIEIHLKNKKYWGDKGWKANGDTYTCKPDTIEEGEEFLK